MLFTFNSLKYVFHWLELALIVSDLIKPYHQRNLHCFMPLLAGSLYILHQTLLSFPIGVQETTHFLSIPSYHSIFPNWHPGDYTLPLNTILPFSHSQLASRRLHTSSQYHLTILSFPIGIQETTHFLSIPSYHSIFPNCSGVSRVGRKGVSKSRKFKCLMKVGACKDVNPLI